MRALLPLAIAGTPLELIELHLKLLILMLQLLDGAGELTQRSLDAVDTRVNAARAFRIRVLLRLLLLLRGLAAIEQIIKESAPGTLLRHGGRRSEEYPRKGRYGREFDGRK